MLGIWVHPCLCFPECGWQTLYHRAATAGRHLWSILISSRVSQGWLSRTTSRWILSISKDRKLHNLSRQPVLVPGYFTVTTLFLILFQFCAHCPQSHHCVPLKRSWLILLTSHQVFIHIGKITLSWAQTISSPSCTGSDQPLFDPLPSAKSSKCCCWTLGSYS